MPVYYNTSLELDNLRESLIEAIENSGTDAQTSNRWGQGHDAVALFSLSHAMMEAQLQNLILQNVFSDEYRDGDEIQGWVSSNGFYSNMNLANNIGLISDGMKGKINDVRKTRNTLLHETDERLNIDSWAGQIDKINKAADTPLELLELSSPDTEEE